MNESPHYDVCIIGAGVAGGAMAAYLGANGLRVAVVEKTLVEQDRIVGELLQPGGVAMLKAMHLENLLDGFDAQEIKGYGLFLNGKKIRIDYPEGNTGRGFRNGKFVRKIREEITSLENVTLIEGTVTNLLEEKECISGIQFLPKGKDEQLTIHARLTIVSDGMFSSFRESLADSHKKVQSYFLGLLLKDCHLPYENCGHVIVAEPSPVLCYPVSSAETRVLIDFPQEEAPRRSEELSEYLRSKMAPQMPEEIRGPFLAAVEEGRFKVMPNHLYPAKPGRKTGAVLLGDALNMRHPLTGAGMTVALTDCYELGKQLIPIKENFTEENIGAAVAHFYAHRHENNAAINILADALYGVMGDEELKDACYDYLQRGGLYAQEPIALLSAVSRDKNMLLRHFFAVAFYGAKNIIGYRPTFVRLKRSYRMLKKALHIVSPLILNEKPNAVTRVTLRVAGKMML